MQAMEEKRPSNSQLVYHALDPTQPKEQKLNIE